MRRRGVGAERRGRNKCAYMAEDIGQPCRKIRVVAAGVEWRWSM
jgi:hypothetical protein